MINIDIMQDASEVVHYDRHAVPLYIRLGVLRNYPEMRALCHWHHDLELIYIRSGVMNYSINGETVLLEPGDTLFVASRQMHYGYHSEKQDCEFVCILCHPSLFSGNPTVEREYIAPVSDGVPYIHFRRNAYTGQLMERIWELKNSDPGDYELEVIGCLLLILAQVYREVAVCSENAPRRNDLNIQRDMVAHIQQHYTQPLTLNEIAAAGNVSRSKCCQIFQMYTHQTPIAFLNDYRLEVSRSLLKNTSANISDIAFSCGFNHLSYFTKLFTRKFLYTPREYRKQIRNSP